MLADEHVTLSLGVTWRHRNLEALEQIRHFLASFRQCNADVPDHPLIDVLSQTPGLDFAEREALARVVWSDKDNDGRRFYDKR